LAQPDQVCFYISQAGAKAFQSQSNFLTRMSQMLGLLIALSLLDTFYGHPQVSFGGSSGNQKSSGGTSLDIADISSRWQGGQGGQGGSQCCCISQFQSCSGQLTSQDDLVGEGLIDQRIVNRPGSGGSSGSGGSTCPSGQKLCCFSGTGPRSQCSGFSSSLTSGGGGNGFSSGGVWRQGCSEPQLFGQKKCGERFYSRPASGLGHGESSPGEFPWTCLILNSNNDFVGTCAIVPENFNNDNSRGTTKVLTAAHNLKNVVSVRGLKVRVGEYDASAYKAPEQYKHEEYNVISAVTHPR